MRPNLMGAWWGVVLALAVLGMAGGPAGATTLNASGGPATPTTISMNGVASHDLPLWGISPGVFSSTNAVPWTPKAGIAYVVEDSSPNDSFLGPGSGGQAYDAEAMYFAYDSAYAYFAVVTGMPSTGYGGNFAGDLAIDINRDGTWDYGVAGITHGNVTKGKLYQTTNSNWPGTHFDGSADPTWMSMSSNSPIAITTFFYQLAYDASANNDGTNNHYLIETAVPLSSLNLSPTSPTNFRLHWTETCANDAIDLNGSFPSFPTLPPPNIPEPTTCTLLGGGLLAALIARYRKNIGLKKAVKS